LNPMKGPDLLLRAFCELKTELPEHYFSSISKLLGELETEELVGGRS
jgi:hypothetical protein